jgi:hypothetical protein
MKQSFLNLLAFKKNICPSFLSVCGVGDYRDLIDKIVYFFNVEDEKHPLFESTIAIAYDCQTKKIEIEPEGENQ